MYERLYFIGNGFDLHHGIKSGYLDYREWLEKNNRSLLEDIDKLYDFCDDDWWSDFEHSLGNIDVAKIANEIYAERRPDFGSEGFRDRDYYEARIEAELIFDKLYKNIRESFKEWIKSLDKGQEDKKVYLNINNAAFINFNYTNTLQDLYGISDNDVYSIHGNVAKGTNLVLGHGKTEDQISPKKPVMPEGLSDEECEKWLDDNATDYSYDITENEVVSQVLKQKKDVAKIIAGNERLWKKLKNVIEMNLYGISFSDIDTPYIDHVAFDREVLDLLPERKRVYYGNLMARLVLNSESHTEEAMYSLNNFSDLYEANEIKKTAQSVLTFLYNINKLHIEKYLSTDKAEVIRKWTEEEKIDEI